MAPAEEEKRGGKEAKEELLNAICRLKLGTAGKATALLALVEYEQFCCLKIESCDIDKININLNSYLGK